MRVRSYRDEHYLVSCYKDKSISKRILEWWHAREVHQELCDLSASCRLNNVIGENSQDEFNKGILGNFVWH